MFKSAWSNFVDYILPYRCISCSELTKEDTGVCGVCFGKLNFITSPHCNICGLPFEFAIEGQFSCGKCIAKPPRYDLGRSLFKFDKYSKKLLYAFIYNDHTSYSKIFSKLLVARYKKEMQDIDIIAPVPMHWLKRLVSV